MGDRLRLSVVILTKNEEARIARCLESVRWVDEIVVVDGMSTDRTAEICRRFGARVIAHPFEGSFAQERNLGMEHAQGDWVLQIDADDVVTSEFRATVERLMQHPPGHAAFKFRRKSYLLGRFMRYGGWDHYLPNLVRRDAVRYEGLVHERPVIRGTLGVLEASIEHHPCESLGAFLDRHNRYTSLAALELRRTRGVLEEAAIRRQLIRKTWKTWWKTYVKKQGWREGLHGLVFSLFYAGIEAVKWAKCWESCRQQPQASAENGAATVLGARPAARAAGRRTLSVVLMTKNEEARLATCLDCVAGWADEIVIIDGFSTDRTVGIARRYTEKVYVFASDDNHDQQWNRGIERATSDWVLHIDADEVVTPRLQTAIDRILVDDQGHSAFEMMRKNYFLGHPMRYGGWYHRHLVLFRRERARCRGRGIHVRLQVEGTIGRLEAELEHYPFTSLEQFIRRQNHYTGVEARNLFALQGPVPARELVYQMTWRPMKLFWKSYVKQQGRREGMYGLVFALLYAFMHVIFWAKYWEQMLAAGPQAACAGDREAVPEELSRDVTYETTTG